jgi:hypothetical protein
MIINLIDYYKTYHAYEILRNTKLHNIKQINDHLNRQFNMDILRLKELDMKENTNPASEIFMNEINKKENYYYNYNYNSNDEAFICYKNNIKIVELLLLKNSTYLRPDGDGNNILHYLVQLENYLLFSKLYEKFKNHNQDGINNLKNLKNLNNLIPLKIIQNNINNNKINFYGNTPTTPLYANIYSSDIINKLKNNGELLNIIPKNVKSMFNDLFIIYNLKNVNTDIFTNKNLNISDDLTYDKNQLWDLSELISNLKISRALKIYNINRYRQDKNIESNEFYKRFCNALVHTITLHFSSVFYDMIKKFLIDINKDTLGFNLNMLNEFGKKIFNFDPTYEKQNLAQNIILNLYTYKYKYNDSISQNISMTSLTFILEEKLKYIRGIITKSHDDEYNIQKDKIINYCNQYFDTFSKLIHLFLVNYVKFQELQYSLQKIEQQLKS